MTTRSTAIGEYHLTHKYAILNDRLHDGLTIGLGLFAAVSLYAAVQLYNDNVDKRAELQAIHVRGCPSHWHGKPFVFSADENVLLTRPGMERVACYYRKGTRV